MREILEFLRRPFDPAEVEFKVQQRSKTRPDRGLVVAYVDARAYQERLDEAVLAGVIDDWWAEYRLEDKVQGEGSALYVVSCTLFLRKGEEVHRRTDVGEGETLKGAYSDALKRAGVQFGIGRYLYRIAGEWVTLDGDKIPDPEVQRLRRKLPRPGAEAEPEPGAARGVGEEVLEADALVARMVQKLKAMGKGKEALEVLQKHLYKIGEPPGDIEKVREVYRELRQIYVGDAV